MKIVVIGATGLIGTKVVDILTANGQQVLPASRRTGLDVLTSDGLIDALHEARVVVDVTDSPSDEDSALMNFFTTSTANVLAAERTAATEVAAKLAAIAVGAAANAIVPPGQGSVSLTGWRVDEMLAADDLAGLDAGRADVEPLLIAARTGHDVHSLNVGVPPAAGAAVGVRHRLAEAGALPADIAHSGHSSSSSRFPGPAAGRVRPG